ncbi:MAG: Uma2 family endonuclease [Plectolyngbya sp. WJT66-NPBG17]|jgi:Uma2 family endonuclease|nr:Uma2 family endonuclease [Plectolyngbya sp. WJT66-NPBG17]MBW4527783.1 Uma2 family endonuclease [Phormidium tanganyikae FI6-MK23]
MTQLLTKTTDQRIVLQGNWERFKLIQQGFDATPGAKLSYYEGTIEIFMPGEDHATFAHVIGYLISTFLIDKGIAFKPTGDKTQEREGEASAQADQSYWVERPKSLPDLAIEVVFTSGNASKLAKYRALGVSEVWFWEDGILVLYRLRNGEYERIDRSELPGLEDLDLDRLKRCILIGETDLGEAVRTFRGAN